MQPVIINATLQQALNLIGAFVFAISGALLAVHKRYDIVGMTVLAEITAIGGGVIRDLILGAVPPSSFTDHITFLLPLGAVALVFFAHRYIIQSQDQSQDRGAPTLIRRYQNQIQAALTERYRNRLRVAVLVFDAAGLAVFCISGAAKALTYGLGPVESIALGVLTGIGGGILRDMLANEKPTVLQENSELYAVPAVLGAAIVVAVHYLHLDAYATPAATIAAVLVFVLRLGALRYHWTAPRPWRVSAAQGEPTAKQDDAQGQ